MLTSLNRFLRVVLRGWLGAPENTLNLHDPGDGAVARARDYLRRVAALTGATQVGDGYELHVAENGPQDGKTRFYVRDGYVMRLRDVTDLKCVYEQTCFHPKDNSMPKMEKIATVLLLLYKNPALFDKWALHKDLPFKADGQAFPGPD